MLIPRKWFRALRKSLAEPASLCAANADEGAPRIGPSWRGHGRSP